MVQIAKLKGKCVFQKNTIWSFVVFRVVENGKVQLFENKDGSRLGWFMKSNFPGIVLTLGMPIQATLSMAQT